MTKASPLAMSTSERKAFLAGPRVGVVAAARTRGHAPLASPVWYGFRDVGGGEVISVTAATSEKARLLAAAPSATFLVQDEAPPQRFVAAEGAVEVAPADDRTRRSIAGRYLPAEAVDAFIDMTPSELLVTVRLRIARWRTSDFGKLAG